MENLSKLDKTIWRINGFVLLIIFLASLCGILAFIYNSFSERSNQHDMVQIDQKTKEEDFLKLGYFRKLEGTDFFLVPLTSEKTTDGSFGKYSGGYNKKSRNQLLFNGKKQESKWLWENNKNTVSEAGFIYDSAEESKTRKVTGIVFELDQDKTKSTQLFELSTMKMSELISGVDRIVGIQQTGDHEVIIFYSKSGKSFFKAYNLMSHSAGEEKAILLP